MSSRSPDRCRRTGSRPLHSERAGPVTCCKLPPCAGAARFPFGRSRLAANFSVHHVRSDCSPADVVTPLRFYEGLPRKARNGAKMHGFAVSRGEGARDEGRGTRKWLSAVGPGLSGELFLGDYSGSLERAAGMERRPRIGRLFDSKFSRPQRLRRNSVASSNGAICRPVNSTRPGNWERGAARRRPARCCRAARWRRDGGAGPPPATFALSSMMSPGPWR